MVFVSLINDYLSSTVEIKSVLEQVNNTFSFKEHEFRLLNR